MKRVLFAMLLIATASPLGWARIKLVALPERQETVIRLDNPGATLIEEERVLSLQKGVNKVDFSWTGVNIEVDSIRLRVLDRPESVRLLNVSYPPGENALVWEISSDGNYAERVRISYLLGNIDRLITYSGVANEDETKLDLQSHLVLRNFSGEDFDMARILLDYGQAFEQGIRHEETRQMRFFQQNEVPITKIWTFDARKMPWDPAELENQNVGIPVTYRIENTVKSGLGKFALWPGKARIFLEDGAGGTIFLGEDNTERIPVGEDTELYIGDSRDIVVTQRKMRDQRINIRRNNDGRVVLYDTDEIITCQIQNFREGPAVLTMIQEIPDQWDMENCNMEYTRKDAQTLEFTIELEPQSQKTLEMRYHRRNIMPGNALGQRSVR